MSAKKKSSLRSFDFTEFQTEGIVMLKFGKSGDPKEKLFFLSSDNRYIYWESSFWSTIWRKKDNESNYLDNYNSIIRIEVDLGRVLRIMPGQNTAQFERHAHDYGKLSNSTNYMNLYDYL